MNDGVDPPAKRITAFVAGNGPPGHATTSHPSAYLPPELLAESRRRVTVAALVFAALWTFTLAMNNLGGDAAGAQGNPWSASSPAGALNLLRSAGLLSSLALAVLSVSLRDHPRWVLLAGLVHQVVLGLILGLMNFWNGAPDLYRPSWICIVILIYPAIISDTPGRIGAAAFATAFMDPLGYWIASLRGVPLDATGLELAWTFSWNFVCAGLAFFSAGAVSRLSQAVLRAETMGSYRLETKVAAGGMGEVYLARHAQLASPAAVKLIRPDLLKGRNMIGPRQVAERFLQEARTVATLRSPHTVRLYDFGMSDDGRLYYVMELLEGTDLRTLVERFGSVPCERAICLLMQVCDSLAEAHAAGLVHRDIKPANLFTSRMGLQVDVVKVLDFGLAQSAVAAPRNGQAAGTPAFQAPETLRGARFKDHRSDLYSLGCVGFWLLTGDLVFRDDSIEGILKKHASAEPPAPSAVSEMEVPVELDEALLACLSKDPDHRPRSALELKSWLRACPVGRPWTEERARAWWDQHLPRDSTRPT